MTRPIRNALKKLRMMIAERIPFKIIPARLAPIYEPSCNPDISGTCEGSRDLSVVV